MNLRDCIVTIILNLLILTVPLIWKKTNVFPFPKEIISLTALNNLNLPFFVTDIIQLGSLKKKSSIRPKF